MWCIVIGATFGFLQYTLLGKLINFLLSDNIRTLLSVIISIGKLALILVFLWVVACIGGLNCMLWCAIGMLSIMIILPILKGIKNIRVYNEQPAREKK